MPVADLIGKRFGKLVALRRVANDRFQRARWKCVCDCGKKSIVIGNHLISGNTKSCGCLAAAQNITGTRFGRLTANRYHSTSAGRHFWTFRCDCGAEVVARKTHVISGATMSCGCYRREVQATAFTTHGMTRTTEYAIWGSMLARCTNPGHEQYEDYGGRGISVCSRWNIPRGRGRSNIGFQNFLADMGLRPMGLTLDRIDNDGDYEPGNVRWATWKEQAKSRRPARR